MTSALIGVRMESFATPYPLIFHDGESEQDKGPIGVHSVLTFKRFQALLAQKTGLPPNQLSAVLVCRRTSKDANKKQQKLPINENTNFNIILNQHNPSKEKDCHFLVSLKKSKKERKNASSARKRCPEEEESVSSSSSSSSSSSPRSQEARSNEHSLLQQDCLAVESEQSENTTNTTITTPVSLEKKKANENERVLLLRRDLFKPTIGGEGVERGNMVEKSEEIKKEEGKSKTEREVVVGNKPPSVVPSYRVDAQERQSNYTASTSLRPPTLLKRNGFLTSVDNNRICSTRVSTGSFAGLMPSLSAALNLQQAQANYLNSQKQNYIEMPLSNETLSEMRGVVRGLASMDTRVPNSSGACRYCFCYKQHNINPAPFHLCVQDRVITGIRGPSPAGPIERPVKRLQAVTA